MNNKGFTFIETLVYIAIIGMVVVSFVMFALSISNTRNKNYVIQEVQANARTAQGIINQKIRAATGINTESSTFGSDPGVLSLSMADSAKNPTIINLDQDNGILRITEGLSDPVVIVSNKVKITNLVFTDLTSADSRGNIRIQMTVEYNTSLSDIKYRYSQSLQTAVSLRQ